MERTPAFYPKHMAVFSHSLAFEGLPPSFIESMRKLFDVLDVNKTGTVKLRDITSRWSSDEADTDLPMGVIEHLRKVTNKHGLLTFERFCAGLKIAILRHEALKNSNDSRNDGDNSEESLSRANSLPNLLNNVSSSSSSSSSTCSPSSHVPLGPPKPPRVHNFLRSKSRDSLTCNNPHIVGIPIVSDSNVRRGSRRHIVHNRRHTLQGGLDAIMMKKIKQWEEEKSVLEEGLTTIRLTEEWYKSKIRRVEDRLKLQRPGGKDIMRSQDLEKESQEKVIDLEEIKTLNRNLQCLMKNESRTTNQDIVVQRLKDQNRLLTEEVSKKCQLISILEREKSSIIKQLFQSKAIINQLSQKTLFDETTFM